MPKKKGSLQEKRRRVRNILVGVFFLLCVGILVGVAYLSRLPGVTIVNVMVSGTHFTQEDEIKQLVWEQLRGSYGLIIPYKNSLLYPGRKIEAAIQETFLPVETVSVNRESFTALTVSIKERTPVAVWCDIKSTTSPCFSLDDAGLLFAPADSNRENTLVYQSASVTLGDVFLSGDFSRLNGLIGKLNAATARTPEEIVVDENGDVFVKLEEGGELRFPLSFESQSLLQNIASVFAKQLNGGTSFEYADFRFGNKVYVKSLEE